MRSISLYNQSLVILLENMVVILFCQIMTLHSTLDQNRRVVNAHLLFLDSNSDDLINCFLCHEEKESSSLKIIPPKIYTRIKQPFELEYYTYSLFYT